MDCMNINWLISCRKSQEAGQQWFKGDGQDIEGVNWLLFMKGLYLQALVATRVLWNPREAGSILGEGIIWQVYGH